MLRLQIILSSKDTIYYFFVFVRKITAFLVPLTRPVSVRTTDCSITESFSDKSILKGDSYRMPYCRGSLPSIV